MDMRIADMSEDDILTRKFALQRSRDRSQSFRGFVRTEPRNRYSSSILPDAGPDRSPLPARHDGNGESARDRSRLRRTRMLPSMPARRQPGIPGLIFRFLYRSAARSATPLLALAGISGYAGRSNSSEPGIAGIPAFAVRQWSARNRQHPGQSHRTRKNTTPSIGLSG